MNRIKYFTLNLEQICKKLNMDIPCINQDNRMGKYMAGTTIWTWKDTHKEFYVIRYNLKTLCKARKVDILSMIFHELGHITFNHFRETKKTLSQMEYEAEKFAIENILKYYPKYYKSALNTLKVFKNNKDSEYRKFYDLWEEKTNNK